MRQHDIGKQIAVVLGLAVSPLVERFSRPVLLPATDDEDTWMPRVHSSTTTPFRPGPTPAGGLWSSDEGWGNAR